MWRGWQLRKCAKQRAEQLREFEEQQQVLAQQALSALLEDDIELFRLLVPDIEDINRVVQPDRGRALLHVAAGRNSLPAVEAILRAGGSASLPDGDSQTPVSIAEARVFFHKTRGARNVAAVELASR